MAKPSLAWLLVFVPAVLYFHYFQPDTAVTQFVLACLAIIPLAGLMGKATEALASRTNEGIGGLLNSTFGNMAELIIAGMALRAGLFDIVKASLTGSIIGNILLVLGASFFAGGVKHETQRFNPTAARAQNTMLTLAAISLILPAVFHALGGSAALPHEGNLSLGISGVLIAVYAMGLIFMLRTHKHLFDGGEHNASSEPEWGMGKSFLVLALSTALVAWISEILVGTVEQAAAVFGMSPVFVGVIIVAIVGNAAEHSTAVLTAMKNRMDLSVSIALGSSIQIALFVAPVLVFISYFIAPRPMDLVFTPVEVFTIGLSMLICEQVTSDGESNWLEGAQLLSVYAVLGILFYFLPT